jgi:hypothetical protein
MSVLDHFLFMTPFIVGAAPFSIRNTFVMPFRMKPSEMKGKEGSETKFQNLG